ncbi:MAG: hypothetical protein H0T80_04715 [Betaproteobacteria bacterium]|nr:hypothetical protein [Betaproteobacteria bacterium]
MTRQISKLSSSKPFNITAIELAAPVVERDGDAGAYVNAGLEQQRTHAFRWRGQRLLRLQDGTQRGYRAAKDRHHGIADGLDERSVLFGDDLAQHVEMAHHATKGGGVAEFQTTQTIAPRLQRQRQLALLARRDQLLGHNVRSDLRPADAILARLDYAKRRIGTKGQLHRLIAIDRKVDVAIVAVHLRANAAQGGAGLLCPATVRADRVPLKIEYPRARRPQTGLQYGAARHSPVVSQRV